MRQIWRSLPVCSALAVVLAGLMACSPGQQTLEPTPPAFIKEGDPMDCSNGYEIGIRETTVFRTGRDTDEAYSVSGVRIKDGIQYAAIIGGNYDTGIVADLAVGQSVTHEGVGTFTLLDISLEGKQPAEPGAGGSATFCLEPAPGYAVSVDLVP